LGLVIATAGSKSEPGYREKLDSLLAGVKDHVLMLEQIGHSALLRLMQMSSIVVRGYVHESYGLSRVEALLAGTPVVATRAGEQAFVVNYGHADPASLERAMSTALDGPGLDAPRVAAHFRARALANLDELLSLYRACAR
jgi:glycosyltransferase involved in cell wall biosynthesis